MHPFDFFSPLSLKEAVALLQRDGDKHVIAGGTDLIVEIKENLHRPDFLVDLSKIEGLEQFHYDSTKGLSIGALTRVRQVEESQLVKEMYPALYQAVSQLGSIQIRNQATIIGNICRASPSADTPPPLIVAGAKLTLWGPDGQREQSIEDFFVGPGQTILKKDEIVTNLTVPAPKSNETSVYLKLGRRKAMELATVGVAVSLIRQGELCKDIRIALGAVGPTPFRAKGAETVLRGEKYCDAAALEAARKAMTESKPISDVRSSAEYRREMVGVLTRQAIDKAWQQAEENGN